MTRAVAFGHDFVISQNDTFHFRHEVGIGHVAKRFDVAAAALGQLQQHFSFFPFNLAKRWSPRAIGICGFKSSGTVMFIVTFVKGDWPQRAGTFKLYTN